MGNPPDTSTPFGNKSVVITGGAGFIGSHLALRLLEQGAAITIIDDLSTGRMGNVESLLQSERVTFIESRVGECRELSGIISRSDHVVHLAAAVGVDLVVKSPVRTIHTNLHETEVVLEAAAQSHCPLLLASTSEVYGKSIADEFCEDDDLIIGPPYLGRWSYACSKLMDEFLCMAFASERGLPVRIVRFFNTVGPGQTGRYGMVVPRFVKAALDGKPIRVFGDGQQSRCFCHVSDTVEALSRLLLTPTAENKVVNIGSTEEITILKLAELVQSTLGSTSPVELISYEDAYSPGFQDMQRRKPSIARLHDLTGFTPLHSIESIIHDTAAFFKLHPDQS